MNEKMSAHYPWGEECPLTKRVLEYINEAGGDVQIDVMCHMVMGDILSKIEVTNILAPFVVFCLRDLADTMEKLLEGDDLAVLREIERCIKITGLTIKVPFDPDEDKKK